jgi:hypothetical protein
MNHNKHNTTGRKTLVYAVNDWNCWNWSAAVSIELGDDLISRNMQYVVMWRNFWKVLQKDLFHVRRRNHWPSDESCSFNRLSQHNRVVKIFKSPVIPITNPNPLIATRSRDSFKTLFYNYIIISRMGWIYVAQGRDQRRVLEWWTSGCHRGQERPSEIKGIRNKGVSEVFRICRSYTGGCEKFCLLVTDAVLQGTARRYIHFERSIVTKCGDMPEMVNILCWQFFFAFNSSKNSGHVPPPPSLILPDNRRPLLSRVLHGLFQSILLFWWPVESSSIIVKSEVMTAVTVKAAVFLLIYGPICPNTTSRGENFTKCKIRSYFKNIFLEFQLR